MEQDRSLGLGVGYWRFVAYGLGGVAIICWLFFALILGDQTREPNAPPSLWMGGAVSLTVFSAASAVLDALKSMEEGLSPVDR